MLVHGITRVSDHRYIYIEGAVGVFMEMEALVFKKLKVGPEGKLEVLPLTGISVSKYPRRSNLSTSGTSG